MDAKQLREKQLREAGLQNDYPVVRSGEGSEVQEWGLTKREYFAAMAMQGFCSNTEVGNMESKRIAEFAVDQADALLSELAKKEVGG